MRDVSKGTHKMQMSHSTMSSGTVAPKERFVGRNTAETAVAPAVASFNVGAKSVDPLLQSIGLGEGDHTLQALVRKDKLCLYHAAYKDSELHEQENVRDMQKRVERKP